MDQCASLFFDMYFVFRFDMKTEGERVSIAASPKDTRLNLKLLMKIKKENEKEIRRILNRYLSFKKKVTKEPDEWGGYILNMREFIRAMEIGTAQTVRKKDMSTQTDDNLQSNFSQESTQDNNASRDLFSQETYFSESVL